MSIRTVVEINHDYISGSEPFSPAAVEKLLRFLRSGERWQNGEIPGVRWIGQRHHSETLKIEVK